MSEFRQQLLAQALRLSEEGYFGPEVAEEAVAYSALSSSDEVCLKLIQDYYGRGMPREPETAQIRDVLCQILLLVYRESRSADPALAQDFAMSFVQDFRGHPGSSLLTRWNTLAEAVHAFKMVAREENRLLVWQQTSRLFLSYNEFLNGLLGLLIIAWRGGLRKPYKLSVLDNNYGSKLAEFSELTNGENGVFYLLFRIAHKDLRNAIAHGAAWLDLEAEKVRFTHGQKEKVESEMDVMTFVALAAIGADLAAAYIAALAAITVFEAADAGLKVHLPSKVRKVLEWSRH